MSGRPAETKPSKAALRKAAQQARLEEKRRKRAEAKKRRVEEHLHPQTPDVLPTFDAASNGFVLHVSPTAVSVPLGIEVVPSSHSTPVSSPQLEPQVVCEPVPNPPGESVSVHDQSAHELEKALDSTYTSNASEDTDVAKVRPEAIPISNEVTTTTEPQHQQEAAAEVEKLKKRQNALTRTIWTLIMIGGFIGKKK